MYKAWLGFGANLGNRHQQILDALSAIDAHRDIVVTRKSRILETKAWGNTDQPDFLNMAAAIKTRLKPQALLEACLIVEQALGRKRVEKWGPRLIDIDIIAYENVEIKTDTLTLPHPYAGERDFVLVPLAEIAPDLATRLAQNKCLKQKH